MKDIRNPRLLYAKGLLFLLGGLLAAGLLLAEAKSRCCWRFPCGVSPGRITSRFT
jgi:hypothetical protein